MQTIEFRRYASRPWPKTARRSSLSIVQNHDDVGHHNVVGSVPRSIRQKLQFFGCSVVEPFWQRILNQSIRYMCGNEAFPAQNWQNFVLNPVQDWTYLGHRYVVKIRATSATRPTLPASDSSPLRHVAETLPMQSHRYAQLEHLPCHRGQLPHEQLRSWTRRWP